MLAVQASVHLTDVEGWPLVLVCNGARGCTSPCHQLCRGCMRRRARPGFTASPLRSVDDFGNFYFIFI